jgi:cytochrome c peroxidase
MRPQTIVFLAGPGGSVLLLAGVFLASSGPAPELAAASDIGPDLGLGGSLDVELDGQLAQIIENLRLAPLSPPPAPPPALLTLGEALFFEPLLSGNRNMTCASCHRPGQGTGDGLALAVGQGGHGPHGAIDSAIDVDRGELLARNSPPLYNVGLPGYDRMFRDGRVSYDPATGVYNTPEPALNGADPVRADITRALDGALSAQALFPLLDSSEMRGQPGSNELADAPDSIEVWRRIMARLDASPRYRALFDAAYPDVDAHGAAGIGHVGQALAAYIRHAFRATDTPYDRYLRGDRDALDRAAKRGMVLFFGKARCSRCHSGQHLTDLEFHAVAVPQIGPGNTPAGDDLGVFPAVDGDAKRLYHFKTPPLRNVGVTAPYMHDGVFQTLREVVQHYRDPRASIAAHQAAGARRQGERFLSVDRDRFRNQLRLSALPPSLANPLELDDEEVDLLVAFLERGLTEQ